MSLRTLYEIASIILGSLSLYMLLLHLSTPGLRGVRWVAIGYASGGLGIALRTLLPGRLPILAGNLLLGFLCIAFYWGLAALLSQPRRSAWPLLTLLPILFTQTYFLFVHPWVAPRSIALDWVQAIQSLLIAILLLRNGAPRTRLPRLALTTLFLSWMLLEAVSALATPLAHRSVNLDLNQILDSRVLVVIVLLPVLATIMMCLGFLWLAMTHLQQELEHQSHTDVLTGLLNRRALQAAAAREIALARRRNTPLALLLLDLDYFKAINDRHGHNGGDAALTAAAACLTANLRHVDLVARIGGEEFVALLPNSELDQALTTAERLRIQIEVLTVEHLRLAIPLTASFGATQLQPGDTAIDDLLRRADQALYQAKNQGRNRVAVC
jgi:diguanylate cyclase (GGDEF)-like protein